MKKIIEKNLAEIIILTVILFACSSCASTKHHAPGITEWNKQYNRSCR